MHRGTGTVVGVEVGRHQAAVHDSLYSAHGDVVRKRGTGVYYPGMPRFGPQQDLFAPPPETADPPHCDPVEELTALLDRLRAAEQMPWPDVASAMAEELHAIGLGRQVGAEGKALVSAILEQTERLLALSDQG